MKIKRILRYTTFLCSVFIMCVICVTGVKAETQSFYSRAIRDTGGAVRFRYSLVGKDSVNAVKIMKWGNSEPVYCIEPGKLYLDFSEGTYNYDNNENSVLSISSLTKENLRKLKLISYYGFGYGDHNDDSWYLATQLEIWNTISPDCCSITYGDSNLINSQRNEIRNLVNRVTTLPSFQNRTYTQVIGDKVEYVDTNNAISNYSVTSCTNCSASISGNKLIVNSNQVGSAKVNLSRSVTNYYSPSVIYYSGSYQMLMEFGSPDPMTTSVALDIIGGTIKVQKLDSATGNNTSISVDASLANAEFSVYDENNKLVGTIITNENGYGELLVGLGKFTVVETKAPQGYLPSEKKYSVNLTNDNTEESIIVKEDVIRGHALITKEYGDDELGYVKEAGAEFEIIDSKGNIIETIRTDEDGVGIVKLPYGKYTLKQTKGLENYSIASDIEIDISKNNKIYKFNVKNLSYPRLEIEKSDLISGNKLSGATIEIYKENSNGEYELYSSQVTDNEGKINIKDLLLGKYYFIETIAPDGYILDSSKHYFEITEYGKTYKEPITNEKYSNLEITKKDISSGDPIEGVTIEIYKLNEDSNEYELYYSQITDKGGKLYLDAIEKGNYYFIETALTDNHYLLSDEKHYFDVTENNITYKEEFSNDKYSELIIIKTDIETEDVLENALIEIYKLNEDTNEYELYYSSTTDKDGKIYLDIIQKGKYYFKEVQASNGYIIDDEEHHFEVDEYNKVYELSLSNEKEIIDVPDTITEENYKIYYISALLCMIGIAILIYEKTKYKK